MSKKRQTTLFKYGYSKKVKHRNELVEVCGEKLCTEEPGLNKCDDCDNRFKTRPCIECGLIKTRLRLLLIKSFLDQIKWMMMFQRTFKLF